MEAVRFSIQQWQCLAGYATRAALATEWGLQSWWPWGWLSEGWWKLGSLPTPLPRHRPVMVFFSSLLFGGLSTGSSFLNCFSATRRATWPFSSRSPRKTCSPIASWRTAGTPRSGLPSGATATGSASTPTATSGKCRQAQRWHQVPARPQLAPVAP